MALSRLKQGFDSPRERHEPFRLQTAIFCDFVSLMAALEPRTIDITDREPPLRRNITGQLFVDYEEVVALDDLPSV